MLEFILNLLPLQSQSVCNRSTTASCPWLGSPLLADSPTKSICFEPVGPHFRSAQGVRQFVSFRSRALKLARLEDRLVSCSAAQAEVSDLDTCNYWFQTNGGRSALEIEEFHGVRGLKASRSLPENECVIYVPENLYINSDSIARSELARILSTLEERIAIALFLLFEKNKGAASFWNPYIKVLPKIVDTPLVWDEEEIEAAQGTSAYHQIQKLREFIDDAYDEIVTKVLVPHPEQFPPELYTKSAFTWALNIVFSRSLRLLRLTPDGCIWNRLTLIPFVDFLNHSVPQGGTDGVDANTWRSFTYWELGSAASTEGFNMRIISAGPIMAGAEVFLSYGQLSNSKLLSGYGFVLDNNPFDCVDITLELQGDDRLLDVKLAQLHDADMTARETFYVVADHLSQELFSYAAVLSAQSLDELKLTIPERLSEISGDFAQRIYATIAHACSRRLQLLQSTGGERTISASEVPVHIAHNRRLALVEKLRGSEVRILEELLRALGPKSSIP